MANQIVPIDQASTMVPALARQRAQQGITANKNFEEGIRDAFPLLSVKGKVFSARISGQSTPFLDPATRQPYPFLDVVLVNASRNLSKAYYIKGFAEGDMNPPDCWSLDSIRPDPSVAQKVCATCTACPMNAFGSKITEDGKQAKACQDARRVAVMMPHQLGQENALVLMLRVPQSSLKNLKAYAELLSRHGFEPGACVTRIAFDYQVAFPKLLFNFVAPLNDAQFEKVVAVADSPQTTAMLMAPDFEQAPSTAPRQAETVAGLVQQEAPVLPGITDEPTQQTSPLPAGVVTQQQAAPILQAVPAGVIELPDGTLFNPATGQYVERPQPQNMPEDDPATIALPDGKFFNTATQKFVVAKHKGAAEVGAAPPATKRTRAPNKPKEPQATTAAAATTAQPQQQGQAAPVAQSQPNDNAAQLDLVTAINQAAGESAPVNGAATVTSASPSLDEVLKAIMPSNTTAQ